MSISLIYVSFAVSKSTNQIQTRWWLAVFGNASQNIQDKIFRRKRLSTGGAKFVHVYLEIWDKGILKFNKFSMLEVKKNNNVMLLFSFMKFLDGKENKIDSFTI